MKTSLQEAAAHDKAGHTPLDPALCQAALLVTAYILDSKLVITKP